MIPAAPYLLGAGAALAGVVRYRGDLAHADGERRLALLAPLCVGVPMAVFGGDHLTFANIAAIVPAWIPWHEFWRLFVGACLIAGGFAIAARIQDMTALGLFGTMMLLFVALMHIPGVLQLPGNRFEWGVLSRDATFGLGVLSLVLTRAGAPGGVRLPRLAGARFLTLVRVEMGVAALFWAVEQVLHPTYRPGIALQQVMPSWMPLVTPIAWVSALALLACGLGLIARGTPRAPRMLALAFLVFAVVLGVPITIADPADIGGLNYIMDNLMMSGVALCLAVAAATDSRGEYPAPTPWRAAAVPPHRGSPAPHPPA